MESQLPPRQVSSLLKEYGIKSKSVRIGYNTPKGFEKAQFDDAFSRYLSLSLSPEISRHTQQTNANLALCVSDSALLLQQNCYPQQ